MKNKIKLSKLGEKFLT